MTAARPRPAALILFVAWLVIAFITTWHHEPWRDEADAWLYARDVPLADFFNGGRYGGTPMLWYLVQVPFSRLGLHYDFQRWLHLAIAATAMWLFVVRSPLPLWARAAFAFSFFGLFEYAVVARSYSLTLLFLWLACRHWTLRRRSPWFFVAVGLLAQTNLPGMIIAGALLAVSVTAPTMAPTMASTTEPVPIRWSWFAGAVVAWLLAVAQVWPPDDGQKSVTLNIHAAVSALQHGLFPWGPNPVQGIFAGVALGVMLVALWRRRTALAFYLVSVLGFTLLFQFVHAGALRHFGFLFVCFVAAVWLAAADDVAAEAKEAANDANDANGANGANDVEGAAAAAKNDAGIERRASLRRLSVAVAFVALPWVVEGRAAVLDELSAPFSNARGLGEWIVAHKLEKRRFVLAAYAVAVAPWLEGPLYYPATRASTSYLPWNSTQYANRSMGSGGVCEAAKPYRAEHPDALVIVGSRLPRPERWGLRLLHAESYERWQSNGEDLFLYGPIADGTSKPRARADGNVDDDDDKADDDKADSSTDEAP